MKPMKIVIIDDEEDIGFILGFELQELGHQTVCFQSALEAQNYLRTESADVILCDFQMPGMKGMDLLNWLKTEGKKVSFYILTGELNIDAAKLREAGVTDILYKPQDLMRLASIFK